MRQHHSSHSAPVHPTDGIGAARGLLSPSRRAEGGRPSPEGPPPPPPGGRPPKPARLAPASVSDTAGRPPSGSCGQRETGTPGRTGAGTGRAGPRGVGKGRPGRPLSDTTRAILARAAEGQGAGEIATALELRVDRVRWTLLRHGVTRAPAGASIAFHLGDRLARALAQHAAARGCSLSDLACAIVAAAARADIVDAVLDDRPHGARPA